MQETIFEKTARMQAKRQVKFFFCEQQIMFVVFLAHKKEDDDDDDDAQIQKGVFFQHNNDYNDNDMVGHGRHRINGFLIDRYYQQQKTLTLTFCMNFSKF